MTMRIRKLCTALILTLAAAISSSGMLRSQGDESRLLDRASQELRGSVRSITVFEYYLPNPQNNLSIQEEPRLEYEAIFDEHGNTTTLSVGRPWELKPFQIKNIENGYDGAGLLESRRIRYEDWDEETFEGYGSDSIGNRVVTTESSSPSGTATSVVIYDRDGDIIEGTWTDGTERERLISIFDSNSRLLRTDCLSTRGSVESSSIYRYDTIEPPSGSWATGPLLLRTRQYSDNDPSFRFPMVCRDAQGRLVWESGWHGQCLAIEYSISYFDSNGRKVVDLAQGEWRWVTDTNGFRSIREIFDTTIWRGYYHTYDHYGNVTKTRTIVHPSFPAPNDRTGDVRETETIEYRYDDHGNWTSALRSKDGKPILLRTRHLTYYPESECAGEAISSGSRTSDLR